MMTNYDLDEDNDITNESLSGLFLARAIQGLCIATFIASPFIAIHLEKIIENAPSSAGVMTQSPPSNYNYNQRVLGR